MNRFIKLLILVVSLQAPLAFAETLAECEGDHIKASIDHLVKEVYSVTLTFPGGGQYKFQAQGVVRSDRGFATRGEQGIVYSPGSTGQLEGWIALQDKIIEPLSCKYLH